jgi:hypothetical protein
MDSHREPVCQPVRVPQPGQGALSGVSWAGQGGCKECEINSKIFFPSKTRKNEKKFLNTKKTFKISEKFLKILKIYLFKKN